MNPFGLPLSLHAALDRPVWSSLNGGHRHLALGGLLAQRYPRDIGPFAALASEDPPAWMALAELLLPGEASMLVTPGPVAAPADTGLVSTPLEPVLPAAADASAPEPGGLLGALPALGTALADDATALLQGLPGLLKPGG